MPGSYRDSIDRLRAITGQSVGPVRLVLGLALGGVGEYEPPAI